MLPGKADTVVIGAGFTGLTAARALAKQGRHVVVLEAGLLGSGASGANAGFVVPNFAKADPATVYNRLGPQKAEGLLRLVGNGADTVFGIIREDGISCDASQNGWLQPAFGEAMAQVLRKRASVWQRLDRPVRFLEPDEIAHETGMDIYSGGIIDESGGTIHPLDYLYGLARTVLREGGLIRENAFVQSCRRGPQGWEVEFTGGSIHADSVLLCTNAFTTGIAGLMGRTGVPLRVYQVATGPIDEETVARISPRRRPVGDTRLNLFTYRLDRDNRLISGGMAILPFGARERVAKAVVRRLVSELKLARHPGIDVAWTGTAIMTPDFLPRIYDLGEGFFGGVGCNGRGIAMTAQLGGLLARAAMGEAPQDMPISFLRQRPLPLHAFAPLVASAGLAHARLKDRLTR